MSGYRQASPRRYPSQITSETQLLIHGCVFFMFFVYILKSERKPIYYIGQTENLDNRVSRHNSGFEPFTSKWTPWKLVWFCSKPNRLAALQLEKKLKNLSPIRIERFIQKYA